MHKLNLTISLEKYDNENELTPIEQKLLSEARKATYKSYAPYSKFHVGAAVLLDDDQIIIANNQENAAFSVGFLCGTISHFLDWSKLSKP